MVERVEHIGTRLRRIRREREDSQEQVAALMGVTQPTFSRVERGRLDPPPGSIPALARYLSTPERRVTVAEVRQQIDRYNLQQREAELTAELDAVRGQLAAHG